MNISIIYFKSFLVSLLLSLIAVPVARYISIRLGHYDVPGGIKTHSGNVPLLGGVGVIFSFIVTLVIFRFFTSFPTGTLRELRYIIIGGLLIFLIGFVDDLRKPIGIKAWVKFVIEVIIAVFMITRGFSIDFIKPQYVAYFLTVLWIVGITNALNIIDIMDGLCSSQVFIASMAFFFITMPSEAVHVNFLSIVLAGAILGFIPYNLSNKYKIFLGDSGSLFCGFILSVVSLGAEYSDLNPLGVYAPVLILSIPIYDTLYVSYLRMKKGISPFTGTRDHFALRFEAMGYGRRKIVIMATFFSVVMALLAYTATLVRLWYGIIIYLIAFIFFIFISKYISSVEID
ncbi:MAG: undecaprenyl/decaprenyl-phosphate alpha-N-acetylglucosaminyl 1-phosphate transferase [Elusimicrobiota bacterium]